MYQQMKYFIAVVNQHNFTRAAEECNISQSAISQQIKELEITVGVKLIARKGRSFELTEAGKYFYQHSQEVISSVEQLLHDTRRIADQQRTAYELHLGYLMNFGSKEFLQAVAEFSKKYPEVKVNINSGMHEYLFDLLRNDKIDLNFSDQRRALSNEYNNEFLTETDFMAVVPQTLTIDDKITTDELADLPCIIVAGSKQEVEEENYYRDILGIKSQFVTASTGDEAQLMVAANQGYLIANSRTINLVNQDVTKVVRIFNGNIPLHQKYYAYWKKDNSGYYIEKFADILKEQF